MLIDGSVQIAPFAADLDIGLINPLDAKVSFRDKSLYWSHGKCDTLKNSKTTLFPAF